MRRPLLAAASALAALLTSVALAPVASADPSPIGLENRNTHVCGPPAAGFTTCDAVRHEVVDHNGRLVPQATGGPAGYGASAIQSAYNLASALTAHAGAGRVVAVVDAYDSPSALTDLNSYRRQFGIAECNASNPCFRKLNQDGVEASYPAPDTGWAQEISLDLDMVSAACPDCSIVLVEANSSSFADLAVAVETASNVPGVVAISNSYGGREVSSPSLAAAYDQPGIAVTASTGDSGYGVQVPAAFPGVIAVGGTTLKSATGGRGWSETAWSGAGSGCSKYSTNKRGWQSGTGCANKATADVSAVADPNTGVAVFGPLSSGGGSGWMVFGGTSASSPIIASVYAMGSSVGHPSTQPYPATTTWAARAGLNDVTSGSNGKCAGTTRSWCTAVSGWDGPTGRGTPNGTTAF
jgi:subtilase family serine protease